MCTTHHHHHHHHVAVCNIPIATGDILVAVCDLNVAIRDLNVAVRDISIVKYLENKTICIYLHILLDKYITKQLDKSNLYIFFQLGLFQLVIFFVHTHPLFVLITVFFIHLFINTHTYIYIYYKSYKVLNMSCSVVRNKILSI